MLCHDYKDVTTPVISTVGLDLRSSCFTHGQFYVAASRISRIDALHVLAGGDGEFVTTKVVYPEALIHPE